MVKIAKHWVEKARIWSWYHALSKKTGKSDYWLDQEFTWIDGFERIADERQRVFERIRKDAFLPSGNKKNGYRSFQEILDAIKKTPELIDVNQIYESKLWDLLKASSLFFDELEADFYYFLEKNSIVSVDPERFLPEIRSYPMFIEKCLINVLSKLSKLNKVLLLSYLYLLNKDTQWFRSLILPKLEENFDVFYIDFFEDSELHWNFYCESINALYSANIKRARIIKFELSLDDIIDGALTGKNVNFGITESKVLWPLFPAIVTD